MKIALAQYNIWFENKIKNKDKCLEFLKQAKDKDVDLIVFPEMSLTGFSMNVELTGENNSETIEWFKEKAVQFNLFIGFGYVNKADNKGLNMFSIVSSEGKAVCSYTKIHPFSYSKEDDFFKGGNEIVYTKIKDLNVSPFICYDLRFPEIFQIASKEANLILVAANWPKSRRDNWITLLKARAIENQCYVAGVNAVGNIDGLEYAGDSMIIDPIGRIVSSGSDNEELVVGDISLSETLRFRTNFPIKKDRKETLYHTLKVKKQD